MFNNCPRSLMGQEGFGDLTSFRGVNAPPVADFKLLGPCHRMQSWLKMRSSKTLYRISTIQVLKKLKFQRHIINHHIYVLSYYHI